MIGVDYSFVIDRPAHLEDGFLMNILATSHGQ